MRQSETKNPHIWNQGHKSSLRTGYSRGTEDGNLCSMWVETEEENGALQIKLSKECVTEA